MKNLLTCSIFIILRCYPLDYVCKGTVFFDTVQIFSSKKERNNAIIDINQQFVCEHTYVFAFICFCFMFFYISRRKHRSALPLIPLSSLLPLSEGRKSHPGEGEICSTCTVETNVLFKKVPRRGTLFHNPRLKER
jgi:hypothetical protein